MFPGWQVEWIQQQVVKRRIKRDYKPGGTQSTYFNDPKWPSMWYMVSIWRVIDSVSCSCLVLWVDIMKRGGRACFEKADLGIIM